MMHEVYSIMGITTRQDQYFGSGKTFSSDVFSLELSGPDQAHLSVIDVPGIFKKTTEGLTTKHDIAMVTNMVKTYMQNPRSVVLAVIPANVDIATQEILEMAEEVDPDGERTLGVLTKPDLVDKGGESAVMELIEGNKHRLRLGWHVLRNPGQQDLLNTSCDRTHVEHEFFKITPPWNKVKSEAMGIAALRLRLQHILADHIRREYPKVRSEINKRLRDCRKRLEKLGSERELPEQQRRHLVSLALKFQQTTDLALNTQYSREDMFDRSLDLRLATAIVSRNELFSQNVEHAGHTYDFRAVGSESRDEASDDEDNKRDASERSNSLCSEDRIPPMSSREVETHQDLQDIVREAEDIRHPDRRGMHGWLRKVYHTSRGFELGTFDPSLLAVAMKEQTTNWPDLSQGYIDDVINLIHRFITTLLGFLCPQKRMFENIMLLLMEPLLESYRCAIDQVRFIVQVERSLTPITLNHYFNDNVDKSRHERLMKRLESNIVNDCSHGKVVKFENITARRSMSNAEAVVEDLHDVLKSYYKVARKRFVDTICMQATDFYLVSGLKSPLKIFSPALISELTDAQLEQIAGEDTRLKDERRALRAEMRNLEAGRKILL